MATTTGIFHSGAGIPLNSDGVDGDHYRNTTNQDLWFKSGGTWGVVGNLRDDAPDGIGTTIQHGAGNPLNVNGEDGFYYRDTLNQNLWFKVEGLWHVLCRLGAPDQGGGGGAAATTVLVNTANTTVVVEASQFTHPGGFMWNTTSASPVTVEFPTPLSLGMIPGQSQQINIRQGGTGVVTATGTGGAILEGAAVFTQQYEVKTFMSKDDTTWIVVGAQ